MGKENRNLVPTWKVKVCNTDVDKADYKGTLRRVTVSSLINGVNTAVLEFDARYGNDEVLQKGEFKLENEVEIKLGYKDEVETVFKGSITGFENSLSNDENGVIRVLCSDSLYKTANGIKIRSYEKKSCSDVIKEIFGLYGIKCSVEDMGEKKNYILQNGMTDLDYVMSIVKKYGMMLFQHDDTVYIGNDIDSKISAKKACLEWGHNMISFEGHESVEGQVGECTFEGTNCKKNEPINGTAGIKDVGLQVGGDAWNCKSSKNWESRFRNDSMESQEEAKVLAKAVLQETSMKFQTAFAETEGLNSIFPAKRIDIKAVGCHFSGTWLVERTVHDCCMEEGGFRTQVWLRRNKGGDRG